MAAVATPEAPPGADQALCDDGLTFEDVVVASAENDTCLVCASATDQGRCPDCGSELT
jgi:hypothetical protein